MGTILDIILKFNSLLCKVLIIHRISYPVVFLFCLKQLLYVVSIALFPDLTMDSFPKEMLERKIIYWHGKNKDGHKISKLPEVNMQIIVYAL